MSGIPMNNDSHTIDSVPPPSHHLHSTSERLPGAKGGDTTVDYSPATMDRTSSSAWNDQSANTQKEHSSHDTHPESTKPPMLQSNSAKGQTAFNTDRPLGVKPSAAGGVAIGGRDDVPEGKAGLGDKLLGKTQKVVGKYTHNMDLHEKGELREAGGKAAVLGQARAPHD